MGSGQERIDIFDREMNFAGTAVRAEAHRNGYWHKTFQCWIAQPEQERYRLLFQKRHPSKDTFPGKLDKTAAGHLLEGETVEDGIREIQEEIGLDIPFRDLYSCGVIPMETPMKDGGVDREFCHVFLYTCPLPLELYRLEENEVAALYAVDAEQFRKLVYGEISELEGEGIEPGSDGYEHTIVRLGPDDFTPQSDEYYRVLFQNMERLGWLPSH